MTMKTRWSRYWGRHTLYEKQGGPRRRRGEVLMALCVWFRQGGAKMYECPSPRSIPFLSLVIRHFTRAPWGAGSSTKASKFSIISVTRLSTSTDTFPPSSPCKIIHNKIILNCYRNVRWIRHTLMKYFVCSYDTTPPPKSYLLVIKKDHFGLFR